LQIIGLQKINKNKQHIKM